LLAGAVGRMIRPDTVSDGGSMTRSAILLVAVSSLWLGPLAWGQAPAAEGYRTMADDVHKHFDRNVLGVWFPRCVDERRGGFISTFDREWRPAPTQDRFLVFQARMTWLTSQVAMRRPELREEYLRFARHGVSMRRRMRDE
jgi:hypothetical protein